MSDLAERGLIALSTRIEELLVQKNPRGMRGVSASLPQGSLLRAARTLLSCEGNVIICTGFPVANTFETDGPAGALALYGFCESLGLQPWLLVGEPLANALGTEVRAWPLNTYDLSGAEVEALRLHKELAPGAVIVIERPGAAADGRYYNIAGADISSAVRPAEPFVTLATCPVIAIGDGGNELGMGLAGPALEELNITPAVTGCDELIVADVSNWGAYALIAMVEFLLNRDPLAWLQPQQLIERLVEVGAVDGITHRPEATEDGMAPCVGEALVAAISQLLNANRLLEDT